MLTIITPHGMYNCKNNFYKSWKTPDITQDKYYTSLFKCTPFTVFITSSLCARQKYNFLEWNTMKAINLREIKDIAIKSINSNYYKAKARTQNG